MRIMRVSLTVGAVVAVAVATGGAAVAAPAGCYVQAKRGTTAFVFNAETLEEIDQLTGSETRDSECKERAHPKVPHTVYLKGGKKIVSAKQVNIKRR